MSVTLDTYKVLYMPVPKAACTSVKVAMARLDPQCPIRPRRLRRRPLVVHEVYRTSRFRPHRWQAFEKEGFWTFTVVRDPVERLLSVFSDLVAGREVLRDSPQLRQQQALSVNPDPDFFFQNLSAYMDRASIIKHHALPAHLFIGPDPALYDRVYRTHEMNALAGDLSARSGQVVTIPHANKSASKTKLALKDLAPKTVNAIRTHVASDYALLRDFFPSPFGELRL